LALQHGVDLQMTKKWHTPETGPSYEILTGCTAVGDGDYAAAAARMPNFFTPAPRKQVEAWLAELSVITARQRASDFEDELRLEAHATRLSAFPADVVRYATLVHPWHFWPTWEELKEVCERLVTPRRAMLTALERGAAGAERERQPQDAREPAERAAEKISAEERAKQSAVLSDLVAHLKAKCAAERTTGYGKGSDDA
jgi:hypothetical protein